MKTLIFSNNNKKNMSMDDFNNIKNFDKKFRQLLHTKGGRDILKGRCCMESIKLKNKVDFIMQLFLFSEGLLSLTYKIFFWETDKVMEEFVENNFLHKTIEESNKPKESKICVKARSYKGKRIPGVMYLEDQLIDGNFFKKLLNVHFNFELALEPSLSLRVQICVNKKDLVLLLDIYDDRGFNLHMVTKNKNIA